MKASRAIKVFSYAMITLQVMTLTACQGSDGASYGESVATSAWDRPSHTENAAEGYSSPSTARGAAKPQCWAPSVPSVARPGLCFTCPPGTNVVVNGNTERCDAAPNGGGSVVNDGGSSPSGPTGGICVAPSVPSVARPGLCFTCPPGTKVVVNGMTESCQPSSDGVPATNGGGVGQCPSGAFPSALIPGQCRHCPPSSVALEVINGAELCRLAACLPPASMQVINGVNMCVPR